MSGERNKEMTAQNEELDPAFEEEVTMYAFWSLEDLHNLARELEIPDYWNINREALIEMMIRRLF